MRALVFDRDLSYREDYPEPEPSAGEALVRVLSAGICSTDIEIVKGYMGFRGVPGHEFVGVVEACRDAELVGKRVVGEINAGCGACAFCNGGLENHCPQRTVLGILGRDGAFAELLTLPAKNLHLIPDSIADEEAVFVEPLAAAFEITGQVAMEGEKSVCVLGDGRIGLLVSQVLSLTGCDVTVAGRHRDKLSILDARGLRTALAPDLEGRSFDCVVDCTGSPSGMEAAFGLVRPRGTIVVKTTVAGKRQIDLNRVVIDEVTIIGSRCGPFGPAIRALEERSVDVRPLVTRTFHLEQGIEAFGYAVRKGVLKVILDVA